MPAVTVYTGSFCGYCLQVKALLERRIITGTSSDPKVLRLLPPLCLTLEEAGLFVDALKAAKLD